MLEANFEMMSDAAKQINGAAQRYVESVEKLYDIVNNLSSVWAGTDNEKFTQVVEGYHKDINDLGVAVNNYAKFLQNAAQTLATTQQDVSSSASGL